MGTEAPSYFPGDDWATGELGFDPVMLRQITSDVDPDTNCLLVTRHGRLVGEWYWNDWGQDTASNVHSVTQAWSSTLVGIAQDQGLLDIDDPVSEYLPEWQGTDQEDVTIRHILSHSSGLRSSDGLADEDLIVDFVTSEDPGRFALSLPQEHEPGTSWSQNLPAIELLSPILATATGQDPAEFAAENLFEPIGATHTSMETGPTGAPWVMSYLQSSCRDLARFGYLILQEGNRDGTQVVSQEWVREATQPSQDLNKGLRSVLVAQPTGFARHRREHGHPGLRRARGPAVRTRGPRGHLLLYWSWRPDRPGPPTNRHCRCAHGPPRRLHSHRSRADHTGDQRGVGRAMTSDGRGAWC